MENIRTQLADELKKPLRQKTYVKVTFGLSDPQAVELSTIESNGEFSYSETNSTDDESKEITNHYGNLQLNSFILDGNSYPVPDNESDVSYQGYVSSIISGSDGAFGDEQPVITISFSDYVALAGLTITFDELRNNYPTALTIKSYNNDVLISTSEASIDDSFAIIEQSIPAVIDEYANKVELIFDNTNYPYRSVRIENILFGLVKIFENDDLVSVNIVKSVDLINSSLPTETMDFSIIDKNREYDPENVSGLYAYLEESQSVKVQIGQDVGTGEPEWFDEMNYLTTGEVSVSGNRIKQVTFKAVSLLKYLTTTFYNGVYSETPRTFFDLATEVIESAGLALNFDGTNKWVFDDVLKDFTTSTPLPVAPVRELLQMIAGACGCVLYTDKAGKVRIEHKNYEDVEDFHLTFNDIFNAPSISTFPILKNVNVYYSSPSVSSETTELFSTDISASEESLYTFEYESSANHEITVDGTVVISGDPVFYASRCYVTLSGSGSVKINGNIVKSNEMSYTKTYNDIGESCPVTMNLINTSAHAGAYADFVANYAKLRILYKASDRGFPQIEPFDVIKAETGYSEASNVIVTKTNISFNGTLTGTTEYYLKGE